MRWIVVLMIVFAARDLSPARIANRWIVWNVGQGSWITVIKWNECLHFDTGGERMPIKRIESRCRKLQNEVFLSHGDWDHIGGLQFLKDRLKKVCLAARPREKNLSFRKQQLMFGLKNCPRKSVTQNLALPAIESVTEIPTTDSGKNPNDLSRVFTFQKRFLMPGDSTQLQEREWSRRLTPKIEVLVLGHHGSKTSTSQELINRLPKLKVAIVSARMKRYGHPHKEVVSRIRKNRIGLLRTEDWGHIVFEL